MPRVDLAGVCYAQVKHKLAANGLGKDERSVVSSGGRP